jgi:hypothetical protein
MSLMEVLISIFILSIGLLGIAALIPIGKMAMKETDKSDRTGACGRAALHDLKVRNLLNTTWSPGAGYLLNSLVTPRSSNGHGYICTVAGTSGTTEPAWPTTLGSTVSDGGVTTWKDIGAVFAVDPLGVWSGLTANLGGGTVPRVGLNAITSATLADQVFRGGDDLIFVRPEEMKSGAPPAGTRPVAPTIGASEGKSSWFMTVAPSAIQPGLYGVSVVVCNQRVLTQTGTQPDGERVAPTTGVLNYATPSYGGNIVTCAGDIVSGPPAIKNGSWVLLYSTGANAQYTWYRVVHAGYDGTNSNITLVGPDWYGNGAAYIVVVDGVTGVYTETVQVN